MRALESAEVLLRRLEERGVAIERRSYFRGFVAEPVDASDEVHGKTVGVDRFEDGDLLLFEAGVRRTGPPGERQDWSRSDGPELYELSLTRQFSFDDAGGEYEGMNAVSLTVQAEPTAALRSVPGEELWGTAGPAWTREELLAHNSDPEAAERRLSAAGARVATRAGTRCRAPRGPCCRAPWGRTA